jgi:hypothetical protein
MQWKLLQEWGKGIMENDGGRIQLKYILSTLVNVTMYPQYNN